MQAGRDRAIRIGCSGWNYPGWKHAFYEGLPARAWLEHAAAAELPARRRAARERPEVKRFQAVRLEDWSREVAVLAYFNNDWELFAVRNALRMKDLLGA